MKKYGEGDTNKNTVSSYETIELDNLAAFAAHTLVKNQNRKRRENLEKNKESLPKYRKEYREKEQRRGHFANKQSVIEKEAKRQLDSSRTEYTDSESPQEKAKEFFKYHQIFFERYGDTEPNYNPDVIREYKKKTNRLDQLHFIQQQKVDDVVSLLANDIFDERALKHFENCITMHEEEDYLSSDKSSVEENITKEAIYSAMIGTPEMAAIRIASRKLAEEYDDHYIQEAVRLHGEYTGIRYLGRHAGNWELVCKEYEKIQEKNKIKDQKQSEEKLEKKCVNELADKIYKRCIYDEDQIGYSNGLENADVDEFFAIGDLSIEAVKLLRTLHKRKKFKYHLGKKDIEKFKGLSQESSVLKSLKNERIRLDRRLAYIDHLSDEEKK